MVELRKRKAPPPPAPPAKKKSTPKTKAKPAPKAPTEESPAVPDNAAAVAAIPVPGGDPDAPRPILGLTVDLDTFGGEIQTHEEKKTTLGQLVKESKAGVILFTYPKASTPGCTTQACLFRDAYDPLTTTGLSIYGLSNDSPKANSNFKQKQNLPYPLLCDPKRTLIEAIGMKSAKGTQRGVFIINKAGQVLAKEPGGPAATVEVVKTIVKEMGDGGTNGVEKAENRVAAETAAEVADTAKTLDEGKAHTPLPSQAAHTF